jgi:hypothetical protein
MRRLWSASRARTRSSSAFPAFDVIFLHYECGAADSGVWQSEQGYAGSGMVGLGAAVAVDGI